MAKKVPSKKTTKSKKSTVNKIDKVKFDEQLKHLDDSLKNEKDKYDLAASFQKTMEEILYKKSKVAFQEFNKINKNKNKTFVVAGGVAANQCLRNGLKLVLGDNKIMFPDLSYCTDNGAMISYLGTKKLQLKKYESLSFSSQPNLKLF